jgi:hypothetical protein
LPVGTADRFGNLEQAEWRRYTFLRAERQVMRHGAVEIRPRHGKRRGFHPGAIKARLDPATRFRLAAPGIRNPTFGQNR